MTLASFLLVAFEHEDGAVRRAARTYLVASHLGAAFLFALFLLLGRAAGSLDFDAFAALRAGGCGPGGAPLPARAGRLRHQGGPRPAARLAPRGPPGGPVATSRRSCPGCSSKMGVYGILRVLTFLPPPAAWRGVLLAAVGLAGALAALALALGQRDLKRVLAYSTVENVGLVALGLGIGPRRRGPRRAGGRGARRRRRAPPRLEPRAHEGARLPRRGRPRPRGGHARPRADGRAAARLPASGALLVLAAAALAGLPPLNGFVAEWLLYLGLLHGGAGAPRRARLGGLARARGAGARRRARGASPSRGCSASPCSGSRAARGRGRARGAGRS